MSKIESIDERKKKIMDNTDLILNYWEDPTKRKEG
jgi:hypothetical protein